MLRSFIGHAKTPVGRGFGHMRTLIGFRAWCYCHRIGRASGFRAVLPLLACSRGGPLVRVGGSRSHAKADDVCNGGANTIQCMSGPFAAARCVRYVTAFDNSRGATSTTEPCRRGCGVLRPVNALRAAAVGRCGHQPRCGQPS